MCIIPTQFYAFASDLAGGRKKIKRWFKGLSSSIYFSVTKLPEACREIVFIFWRRLQVGREVLGSTYFFTFAWSQCVEIHLTAVLCANVFSGMSSPTINRFLKETLLKEVKKQQISEPLLTQTCRWDASKAQRVFKLQKVVLCIFFFFFLIHQSYSSPYQHKTQLSELHTAVFYPPPPSFFWHICAIYTLGIPTFILSLNDKNN